MVENPVLTEYMCCTPEENRGCHVTPLPPPPLPMITSLQRPLSSVLQLTFVDRFEYMLRTPFLAITFPNYFCFYFRKVPSLLEYFSYLFHYSTLLAGPVCTFREFNDFIDGSDIRPKVMYHARVKSAYVCYSLIDDKVRENT